MKFLLCYCIIFSIMTPVIGIMSDFAQPIDVLKLVAGMLFVSPRKGTYCPLRLLLSAAEPSLFLWVADASCVSSTNHLLLSPIRNKL